MMSSKHDIPVFRKRLRIVIANSNLGVYEFAHTIGVNYDTLRKWLSGDRVPIASNLRNLCKICDVSADWLLGLED